MSYLGPTKVEYQQQMSGMTKLCSLAAAIFQTPGKIQIEIVNTS